LENNNYLIWCNCFPKNKYYELVLLELPVLVFPALPKKLVPTVPEFEGTRPPLVFPPPTVELPPIVPAED
jgi:hypothetical protein